MNLLWATWGETGERALANLHSEMEARRLSTRAFRNRPSLFGVRVERNCFERLVFQSLGVAKSPGPLACKMSVYRSETESLKTEGNWSTVTIFGGHAAVGFPLHEKGKK